MAGIWLYKYLGMIDGSHKSLLILQKAIDEMAPGQGGGMTNDFGKDKQYNINNNKK